MFESIRSPDSITANSLQDKFLAFADMLTHLAYLRTIPCPTFNTAANVEFYKKTILLDEQQYFSIPNRNTIAISTLFEILDVRSIIYMWKAMIFDCSLILISLQKSLQFYVAEALKQLIFPLTWSFSYIQPAGPSLIGYAESPTPVIFCCSPLDMDYEYFKSLENSGMKNYAILDIDGSFTNSQQFEELQNEGFVMRTLNCLKNRRIQKYDNAYKAPLYQTESETIEFIKEVRATFFSFIKPFLQDVPKFIDSKCASQDTQTVFDKYFDKKNYLKSFEGESTLPFAQRLVNSSQFQRFCDDYFAQDGANNFRVFYGIAGYQVQAIDGYHDFEVKDFTPQGFTDDDLALR